jgi:uncharacterized protein with GYD domain
MATYVMLTRLSPDALKGPDSIGQLNEQVDERIKADCPEVHWVANYALLGPYDYLDIFEATDEEAAMKVALIVRSFGHATTEIWGATTWERFSAMASHLGGLLLAA